MSLGRVLLAMMLVTSVVATGGCAGRSPHPKPLSVASHDLFPLDPGTFWVYRVQEFDGEVTLQRVYVRGRYFLESQGANGTVVEESGGIGGELSFDVEWHPVVYYRRGEFLYKSSAVNYVDRQLQELPLGFGEEKVLPRDPDLYPAWESDFEVFRVNAETGYKIRSYSMARAIEEPLRVDAGTFSQCVLVETRNVAVGTGPRGRTTRVVYRYLDWYAPGVGLVKSVVEVDEAPRPVRIAELVSFRSGEAPD